MAKREELTAIQKTERLLNYYTYYVQKISTLKFKMDNLIIKSRSKGIVPINQGSSEYLTQMEKLEKAKEKIQEDIDEYEEITEFIDFGLNIIHDRPFYNCLIMKYFEKTKIEKIAQNINKSEKTIKRRIDSLVSELALIYFPKELKK